MSSCACHITTSFCGVYFYTPIWCVCKKEHTLWGWHDVIDTIVVWTSRVIVGFHIWFNQLFCIQVGSQWHIALKFIYEHFGKCRHLCSSMGWQLTHTFMWMLTLTSWVMTIVYCKSCCHVCTWRWSQGLSLIGLRTMYGLGTVWVWEPYRSGNHVWSGNLSIASGVHVCTNAGICVCLACLWSGGRHVKSMDLSLSNRDKTSDSNPRMWIQSWSCRHTTSMPQPSLGEKDRVSYKCGGYRHVICTTKHNHHGLCCSLSNCIAGVLHSNKRQCFKRLQAWQKMC